MNIEKALKLYLVTDRRWLGTSPLEDKIHQAIIGGVSCVQLREKNISSKEFIKTAQSVKNITDEYNVPLIINDNIEVAHIVNADGVHLGQNDTDIITARKILGKDKIIGVSARTPELAKEALYNGADYIGCGAVFPTKSKSDALNISPAQLKAVCECVEIPVIAIGGIDENNIHLLKECKISGIAVISAILSKKDVKLAAQNLLNLCNDII